MNRLPLVALSCTIALLSGCSSIAGLGGSGTDTANDAASSGDTGAISDTGGGTTGSNSAKNTSAISSKSDTNAAAELKVDKAASQDDATKATGAKNGAMNAGKILNLYISDAAGNELSIMIDTEQHPLPANGIQVGPPGSGAWMIFVSASGGVPVVLNSTSQTTGTIDVSACPDKPGVAAVGTLHDVWLEAPDGAPAGVKSLTLNGAFSVVYFGSAGDLVCTVAPPVSADAGGTGADAGTGADGTTPVGGSSCNFGNCDDGTNTTRNCCPYASCMLECNSGCSQNLSECAMDCAPSPDPAKCEAPCLADFFLCQEECWLPCNVSADCSAKLKVMDACEKKAEAACSADPQSCTSDSCCAETKAAF